MKALGIGSFGVTADRKNSFAPVSDGAEQRDRLWIAQMMLLFWMSAGQDSDCEEYAFPQYIEATFLKDMVQQTPEFV